MSTAAPPYWTVIPFVALLLAIAFLPLVVPHWWHDNRNKTRVSLFFGVPAFIIALRHDPSALGQTAVEYVAFVCLLGSLFSIAGGVLVRGSLVGTPLRNTGLLGLGALLANLVGTTGAAMLLIQPYLRANRHRKDHVHLVVFFIFIVANCGGCLTPLGDPPLYLGFLKGVPFQWTFGLWKQWLSLNAALLIIFYVYDRYRFRQRGALGIVEVALSHADDENAQRGPVKLEGSYNLVLLAAVVGVVLLGANWLHHRIGETATLLFQSVAIALIGWLSFGITPKTLRDQNGFTWHPLVEVVVLFAAIFTAMIPALSLLRFHGPSLGVNSPWQYFWSTGTLSAFLDNAPTYLAFLSMSQHFPDEVAGTTNEVLAAIACGAVFFGAMTYIGNGPNFMVKAMAEHRGIQMPSFFGFLLWSGAVLIPLLIALTLAFFL